MRKAYLLEFLSLLFNLFDTSYSYIHSLVNNDDPDKMPHNAAFHQGIHCFITMKQKQYSAKEIHFYVESTTCDPSVYTMDHPRFIASNQKEESFRA